MTEYARNAALGELFLMKTANQISDRQFVDTASYLIKEGSNSVTKALKRWNKKLIKSIKKNPRAYLAGGLGAGMLAGGGATQLAHSLYDLIHYYQDIKYYLSYLY